MPLIISLIRIALSIIFAVAGITKFMDQRGTREAVVNFGAPKSLSPALAILLPLAELTIAIALLVTGAAHLSAWAALVLLALFIVAISVNLARGQIHECHCFGQLYSRPLGWPTLARNVVFALGAIFVIVEHAMGVDPDIAPTLAHALSSLTTLQFLLMVIAIAGVVAAFVYWQRKHAKQAEEDVGGLPVGAVAPHFELEAYEGGAQSLPQLLESGKPLLLIFTNPHCGPCITLFHEISEWQKTHGDKLAIVLITRGSIKENFVNVARNQLGQVLLQGEDNTAGRYKATMTPMAVVVDPQGRIATKSAAGAESIRGLLKQFVVDSNGHHEKSTPFNSLSTTGEA